MNLEKIGKFIAECRKKKNITQQELADKLGVSDRSIGNWENGRNMPDLSMLKPLCKELDITLNDLLSGEKINEKEYQKKFEENIVNTIDYSNKKVKKVKHIILFITIFIILILITLFSLYCIDITRMKNNKPVLFSTWGYSYTPPINLDYENIKNTIKNYLIEEDEKNNKYEKEKSFVALRTYYIIESLENTYYIYAWVLQKKYYLKKEKLIEESISSKPYKFELLKENDKFIVNDYDIPREGSYYVGDMKHIFPKNVLSYIDDIKTDGTIEKLTLEIQNEVDLYFNK